MVDWDRGEYEDTAAELAPAARHVVERAAPKPGHEVLDLGTGTGNAALFAARTGATVTAVDPSPRLLMVAQGRLAAEGYGGTFEQAKAEELPFPDDRFDRVLSLFAVIFSEQPDRAAAEIVRVLKPGGQAFVTAWVPVGGLHAALDILGTALAQATPGPARERFRWSEPEPVTALFADAGASVAVERASITFEEASPEAYVDRFESRHPAGMLFKHVLTRTGGYDDARGRALAAIRDANESETALRLTSTYLVYVITPAAGTRA